MPRSLRLTRALVAAAVLLAATRAHAGEFSGLAALVAALFVGAPLLVMVSVFSIVSLVLGGRADVSAGRRKYGRFALVASALATPLYLAAALGFECSSQVLMVAAVFSLPLVLVSAASIALSVRLLRKNRAPAQPAGAQQ
jgi:hypothetical protein